MHNDYASVVHQDHIGRDDRFKLKIPLADVDVHILYLFSLITLIITVMALGSIYVHTHLLVNIQTMK